MPDLTRTSSQTPAALVDPDLLAGHARAALALHQWINDPDVDQQHEIGLAEQHLRALAPGGLAAAARGVWSWLEQGGARPPLRVALSRYWRQAGLLRVLVPLTGAAALRADAPQDQAAWIVAFLEAIAMEAAGYHEMLRVLERGWLNARAKIGRRRRNSRAARAIDVLAAAPLLSATTLASTLGMSIKCAGGLLDQFVTEGIAIEVTHRSKRRLFGLKGLAPLRDVVRPPYRPDPNRGRGRPRIEITGDPPEVAPVLLPPEPILSQIERQAFDYTALEAAMAHLEGVVRQVRGNLGAMTTAGAVPEPASVGWSASAADS